MRADRLVATLLMLQARGRVTASEVAAELDVSVTTARRDLSALSTAGVPVYAQPGRGGGWLLLGGSRTDLTGLTAPEARGLFLLLGATSSADAPVRSALRKLLQALPETFRADARAAADAVVVDPRPWGEDERPRPHLVEALQDAVVRRRQVSLDYENRQHGRSRRSVSPWGLVEKDDTWYLVAGTEEGQRTFRLDRIRGAVVTDEPSDRPEDFQLATAWEGTVEEVEQHRSHVAATVLIDERFAPVLLSQFGRHGHRAGTSHDGRARLRVGGPTPLSIAQTLAGWGAGVEVLGPGPVRAELSRLGSELVRRYEQG